MQLRDLAKIQTGVFAKPGISGDVIYLQAKHFDENGKLQSTLHPDLKMDLITEKHLLKHGDVLFAAKGSKNFAAWHEKGDKAAVASTSFFVIRLINEFTLPEFLVWFLNWPSTQKFLKANATGTGMVSISKSVLEELEIPTLTIEIQQLIIKISHLLNQEKQLRRQIETLKEKKIEKLMENFIK